MSLQTRFAHTGSTSGVNNLPPNYIAGFIDGEGSFNITVTKDETRSAGHRVVCEMHVTQKKPPRLVSFMPSKNLLAVGLLRPIIKRWTV